MVDAAGTPTTFKVGQVRVENAKIVFRDAVAGRENTWTIERLTADADSFSAPVGLNALGRWNDHHFEVSGVVGATKGLLAPSAPYPLKLKAVLPGLVATVSGTVTFDKTAGPLLAVQFSADATELSEAASLGGYAMTPLGAARVTMVVTGPLGSPSLFNIDAALGRRDTVALTAKGSVKNPRSASGVDLLLFAEGENPAGFNKALDLPVAAGSIKASAHLNDLDSGWRLGDFKASFGHNDLVGDVVWRTGGRRPKLEARLASTTVDLDELTGNRSEPTKARPDLNRIFPDDPLPLQALSAIDADVSWKAERVQKGGMTARQVSVALTMTDGKLSLTPDIDSIAGGKANAVLSVDASGKTMANVALNLDVEHVVLGDLLSVLNVTRSVHGAPTTLRVHVKGTGNSVRAIMAKLSGNSVLVIDKGSIDEAYADAIALDAVRQLAPWTHEQNTQMHCLVSRFAITDGMARSEGMLFDTDYMTVSGQGSVNLSNEVLDLTLAPKPKDTSFLSLAMPLDVGGTIAHPSITPNRGAIVKGVAGVIGAAALGPIGALVPLFSAGSDDANPCLAAIAQPKKAAAPVKKKANPTIREMGKTLHRMLGN